MNTIRQNIKDNSFSHIYLLYGEDDYMKVLYRNKLKNAILCGSDDMNYSYFTGNKLELQKIIDIAETLPFFNDRRLIVIENSNLFAESNDFGDYLKNVIDTTYIVFVEAKVDKRNKLFKTVKSVGYICEMNGLSESDLIAFVKSEVTKAGLFISDYDAKYLLDKIGSDMNTIVNECLKLTSYVSGRDKVTREDIDSICITLLENKIFDMLDHVASKRSLEALTLYNNLIALKESPAKILRLITRHFNILYRITLARKAGTDDRTICSDLKLPPFAMKKYSYQLNKYDQYILSDNLKKCLDIEESFKTGKLDEQIGVELLIISFSIK